MSKKLQKETGRRGEDIAAAYFERKGFRILARNVARKTGELDLVVSKNRTLHVVEVKTVSCASFPVADTGGDLYDPSSNLHALKIRKVARTGEWYVAQINWQGEWQVDGFLVWIRKADGVARVLYLPQIL